MPRDAVCVKGVPRRGWRREKGDTTIVERPAAPATSHHGYHHQGVRRTNIMTGNNHRLLVHARGSRAALSGTVHRQPVHHDSGYGFLYIHIYARTRCQRRDSCLLDLRARVYTTLFYLSLFLSLPVSRSSCLWLLGVSLPVRTRTHPMSGAMDTEQRESFIILCLGTSPLRDPDEIASGLKRGDEPFSNAHGLLELTYERKGADETGLGLISDFHSLTQRACI